MAKKPKPPPSPLPEQPQVGDRIGYARVSREDQDLSVQIAALKRANCVNIYAEKGSAVTGKRRQLSHCKKDLQRGDTLVVWRLDRLVRSVKDLVEWLEWFESEGVYFLSLSENFDTSTAFGRFALQAAAMFAELERNLTIERTKAKLKYLKDSGVKLGGEKILVPEKMEAIKRDLLNPKLTLAQVAKRNKIGLSTIHYAFPGGRRAVVADEAKRKK